MERTTLKGRVFTIIEEDNGFLKRHFWRRAEEGVERRCADSVVQLFESAGFKGYFSPAIESFQVPESRLRSAHEMSLARTIGLQPLIENIYERYGAPRCAKCNVLMQRSDVDAAIRAASASTHRTLALAVDCATHAAAAELSLGDYLEMMGREHVIYRGSIFTREQFAADISRELSKPLSRRRKNTADIHVVLDAFGMPLSWEAERTLKRAVEAAFTSGLKLLSVFVFADRHATGKLSAVLSKDFRCSQCGRVDTGQTAARELNGLKPQDIERRTFAGVHEWLQSLDASMLPRQDEAVEKLHSRIELMREWGFSDLTLDHPCGVLSHTEKERLNLAYLHAHALGDSLLVFDRSYSLYAREEAEEYSAKLTHLTALGTTCVLLSGASGWTVLGEQSFTARMGKDGVPEIAEMDRAAAYEYNRALAIPKHGKRQATASHMVEIRDIRFATWRGASLRFPVGAITCVRGGAGAGKSTLIDPVLRESLGRSAKKARYASAHSQASFGRIVISGGEQSNTATENVAGYCGMLARVAEVLTATQQSRILGLKRESFVPHRSRFSCPACGGAGYVDGDSELAPCELCRGARFDAKLLEVRYRGKSIADMLDMSAADALNFWASDPAISQLARALVRLGFARCRLGRLVAGLSQSELARLELLRLFHESLGHSGRIGARTRGKGALLLLDNALLGLGRDDFISSVEFLRDLTELGTTIVAVDNSEHFKEAADYVIELGCEMSDAGRTTKVVSEEWNE